MIDFSISDDLLSRSPRSFESALENALPLVFSRQTASKCLGGIISPKTLSNLASKGEGPPTKRCGGRVFYERGSFIAWIKQRIF